jgi:ABC-2 type transport system ATP-binding protein
MEKNISPAITVEHLQKNFTMNERQQGLIGSLKSLISPQKKTIHAIKDISLTINEGELVGFIGPNGAGKTTTLKILSGLLYPSGGKVRVLNDNPWNRKSSFLKKISLVMGQKNQLWWDLPAIETLELNKAIYEIPNNEYQENLEGLISMLEVKDLLNIQVRKLSLGQRMRLELVAALIHKPKVLFLDEPTIGLDVIAQQKVREFIENYNQKNNATIILTSHNMDDLVNLTKRVIIIDKGEILFDGDLKDLINKFAQSKIINIYLDKDVDLKKLETVGKVEKINLPQITISVDRQNTASAAAELLQNFPIADLTIEEENIEEIIRRVFKEEQEITSEEK